MAFSLQEALEQLRSDKIKDRQSGLETLDHIFTEQENVVQLDPKGDGKAWLKTFQSLFVCILAEKNVCLKKGSWQDAQPIAVSRLQKAAQTLRSLVEKSAGLLNRKVVKALVVHILQMINYRGLVFRPIASAYISALNAILQHPHHVDHLEEQDWADAVSLCFNALLDRDLNTTISQDDNIQQLLLATQQSSPSRPSNSSRSLSLDDAGLASCLEHLVRSNVAPLFGSDGFGLSLLLDYTSFLTSFPTESSAHLPALRGFVGLIEHLELNETQNVILSALATQTSIFSLWKTTKKRPLKTHLLMYFRIVAPLVAHCTKPNFEMFAGLVASDTSVKTKARSYAASLYHLLLLEADGRCGFEALRLDSLVLRPPRTSGRSRMPSFCKLAFYAGPFLSEQEAFTWIRLDLLAELLGHLLFLQNQHNGDRSVSGMVTASDVGTPQPDRLDEASDRQLSSTSLSPLKRASSPLRASPQKRRRSDNKGVHSSPDTRSWLQELVRLVREPAPISSSGSSLRLTSLQALIFFVLEGSSTLDCDTIDTICQTLLSACADTQPELASWAMVGLASLIRYLDSSGSTKSASAGFTAAIAQAWALTVRKVTSTDFARASAHLIHQIATSPFLPESRLNSDLITILNDLEVQGPPFLCDSVCHLISAVLDMTTSKLAFVSSEPRRKVCSWLATAFIVDPRSPSTSSETASSLFTPCADVLHMLCRVVGKDTVDSCDSCLSSFVALNCDIVNLIKRRDDLKDLRDLILSSDLKPDEAISRHPDEKLDLPQDTDIANSSCFTVSSLEDYRRILVLLQRRLQFMLSSLPSHESVSQSQDQHERLPISGSPWSIHQSIAAIHLGLIALQIVCRYQSSDTQISADVARKASELLIGVLNWITGTTTFSRVDKALLWRQLDAITPGLESVAQSARWRPSLLINPGAKSGIARLASQRIARPTFPRTKEQHQVRQNSAVLRSIWSKMKDIDALSSFMESASRFLELMLCDGAELPATLVSERHSEDDDFKDFRTVDGGSPSFDRNLENATNLFDASFQDTIALLACLLGCVPRAVTKDAEPTHDEGLTNTLFDCSIGALIPLAPVLLRLFSEGHLWFSQRDLSDILDRIGTELLTSYEFARESDARIAALSSVSSILPFVMSKSQSTPDLVDKVQRLSVFFAEQITKPKWRSPWVVRLKCAEFLHSYLCQDPEETFWESGSCRAPSIQPSEALLKVNSDSDVRVRALTSFFSASLFELTQLDEKAALSLYDDFRQGLPSDPQVPQEILTRALSLSNVVIVNATIRRVALFHLLEIVLATSSLPHVVARLVSLVALALGFPEASSFYLEFAGQVTWGMASNSYDPLQIPWKVLGFASKRDCLDRSFAACGSMLLAAQSPESRTQFEVLVRLSRRTLEQALEECLPFLAASHLGFAAQTKAADENVGHAEICQIAIDNLCNLGYSSNGNLVGSSLTGMPDSIISTFLSLYYEPGKSQEEGCMKAVEAVERRDESCARRFAEITPRADDGLSASIELHEPSRPFFSTITVYDGLSSLVSLNMTPFQPKVAYGVLNQVLHRIGSLRFINEQLRSLSALRLYLAMCGDTIWQDRLNVDAMTRGIIALLPQEHLRRDLKPLTSRICRVGWSVDDVPSHLVSCLLRWASSVQGQTSSPAGSGTATEADEQWLLDAVNDLGRSSTASLYTLVLLWPRTLHAVEHLAVEKLITLDNVHAALASCSNIPLTSASLGRIRAVLRKATHHEVQAFCQTTLWMLIDRVGDSPVGQHHQMDADRNDALSDIFALISNRCRISTVVDKVSDCEEVEKSHVQRLLASSYGDQWHAFQAVLVLALLKLVQSTNLDRSYRAFTALRGILVDQPALLVQGTLNWPTTEYMELDRIRSGLVIAPVDQLPFGINEIAKEELVKAAIKCDAWILQISSLMSGILISAQERSAFCWMRNFVMNDAAAARSLFHWILICFTASESGDDRVESRLAPSIPDVATHAHPEFLEGCRNVIGQHFEDVFRWDRADPECWKMIIRGLLAIREWRSDDADPDHVYDWFKIDPILVARRCIDCGLYTAAVLFIEHGRPSGDEAEVTSTINTGERSDLLHQAYMNVDDPDAFYGIKDGKVQDLLIKRLHHEGQWHRALQYHAADFEARGVEGHDLGMAAVGVGQTLDMLGFHQLYRALGTQTFFSGVSATSGQNLSSTAWMSSSWDIPNAADSSMINTYGIADVLKVLHQSSVEHEADPMLNMAFDSQVRLLGALPAESASSVKNLQGDLLALRQIREWRRISKRLGTDEAVSHFRSFWMYADIPDDFELAEKVLMARRLVLQAARKRKQSGQIGDIMEASTEEIAKLERSLLVSLSSRAREHGKIQTAINAIARAQILEESLADDAAIAQEELAAVLWQQNEHSSAMQLLSQIAEAFEVNRDSPPKQRHRKALLLANLAQWRATARSQHPRQIDKMLFEPALSLTIPGPNGDADQKAPNEVSKIAYKWAKFAEDHYRSSNVAEISRLRLYIERRQEEILQNRREFERTTSKTEKNKLLQFQRQAEKILRQDAANLKDLEGSRTLFLRRSVVMYARALATSDDQDDAVARLVSLWFEFATDVELNRLLASCLASIPSRKFVPLTHQLSARVSECGGQLRAEENGFQANLTNLLLRMCQDHPFHTLYAIFALIKSGADSKAASHRGGQGRSSFASEASSPSQQMLRSTAAEKIWNQVKRQPTLSKRIKSFEDVCISYVEWAEFDITSRPDRYFQSNGQIKKGSLRMPPSGELRLSRIRNVDVPVATSELEIDFTCQYATFVSIQRYSETFTTAGGIHLPKISECVGSDGRRYKQLFKRDDDLRQDAVMQQVFRMVNSLLHQDRRTRDRSLLIRTYAVIPLGPQCGLLEFVVNTIPLGEVLIGMHAKYRPNDLSPAQARVKLKNAQSLSAADKLAVFLDVCEEMGPAFRYFFTETQKIPRRWFATRLKYTRSVATNSIVGHILGLGDRHVSNILLDKESGELVHIDFGVAFDQGKLLPIPELVPFRLTRDLVDGMGMNGVEGTFRRCCEETLRVLRAHQDEVKTVLEVFRHDPLFAWTSNPIKVLRAQEAEAEAESMQPLSMERSGSTMASKASTRSATPMAAAGTVVADTAELSADRAINSVMTKLSSSLSVEYMVNDLIQEAMDAGNLSAIFHGWQAAL